MTREELGTMFQDAVKNGEIITRSATYKEAELSIWGSSDDAFVHVYMPYSSDFNEEVRDCLNNKNYIDINEAAAAIDKAIEVSEIINVEVKKVVALELVKAGYIENKA